jgi:hypothetical protein
MPRDDIADWDSSEVSGRGSRARSDDEQGQPIGNRVDQLPEPAGASISSIEAPRSHERVIYTATLPVREETVWCYAGSWMPNGDAVGRGR